MEILKCLNCGSPLHQEDGRLVCSYCGFSHQDDEKIRAAQSLKGLLEQEKAESYFRAKRALYDAVHAAYPDKESVISASKAVLMINDDDALAKIYLHSHDRFPSTLIGILSSLRLDAFEAKEVVRWLSHPLDLRSEGALVDFISRNLSGMEQADALTLVEEEASKESEGFYDPSFAWDVFLCYSSSDMERVIDILHYLESNEFQCFAAFRNLRHGKGAASNYEETLHKAMKSAKAFLFLSSESSRKYSCDAIRIELPYLTGELPDKPRVEYILDDYGEETSDRAKLIIKRAFPSQEWCRYKEDLVDRLSQIVLESETSSKKAMEIEEERKRLEEERRRIEEEKASLSRQKQEIKEEPQKKEEIPVSSKEDLEEETRNASEINGGVLIKYNGRAKNVVIPKEVTAIGAKAFLFNYFIKSVQFHENVSAIGEKAFCNCRELESIKMPRGVQIIGKEAFKDCPKLKSLYIPSSVISIGEAAFSSSIDNSYGLESIAVDPANPKYDSRADCNAIIEKETNTLLFGCNKTVIPNGVFGIAYGAFWGCVGLRSIKIPSSLTELDASSFSGCVGLKTIEVDPDNPKFDSRDNCNAIINKIQSALILGCPTTIIPKTVKWIGPSAFAHCAALVSITIPEGIVGIANGAFWHCKSLTSLSIPSTVEAIGKYAFYKCECTVTIHRKKPLFGYPKGFEKGWLDEFHGKLIWK